MPRDPIRAALIALVLVYAFLAGLKTVGDYDLGWQLATGRYVVEHHAVPSTDVLSYTARGTEWIYPAFSGVFLYALKAVGGWAALSWLNALACLGVVVLLVLPGNRLAALLAALAVPALAFATEARSEVFTTVLFAASFGVLWRHYRGMRTRLWPLPIFLAVWTNSHTGFAAGLALLGGYALLEVCELPFDEGRNAAIERLKRAAPWCALAVLATLVNPWGYRIYVALQRQNEVAELHGAFIGWWSRVRLTPAALTQFVNLRDSASGDWWLLLAAIVAACVCLARKRVGPAVLLAGGTYAMLSHVRFQGLFAILVVTIAGQLPARIGEAAAAADDWLHTLHTFLASRAFQSAVLAAASLVVGLRSYDLITNRHYIVKGEVSLFGTGPSWWYPEMAAVFLMREKLPANLYNDFDLGGYLAGRLGPAYPVYADGRYIPYGTEFLLHASQILAAPPDSEPWSAEAKRRNINTAIFSLSRYAELQRAPLAAFCGSKNWKPVYLDDVSVIFLRVAPENQPWLDRLGIDCRTAALTAPDAPPDSWRGRAELFEFYANAGSVFYVLSRDAEAAAALDRANELFAGDPNLHLIRGEFYASVGRPADAEREYRESLAITATDAAWLALGRLYGEQHRYAEAAQAIEKSAELSIFEYDRYRVLGQIYLAMNQPQQALAAFDRAQGASPYEKGASVLGVDFHARLADGRARAWKMLNDLPRAASYAEEATRLTPESAPRWQFLADIYAAEGKTEAAEEARRHTAFQR